MRTNRDGVIPLVLEHFGALDRMTVQFAGGIWTGGLGELVVVARDPSGRPVANLDCLVDPDDPDAIQGSELFTTDEAGRCRFPNTPADDVTIFLDGIAGEPVQWNGTARARVPAGESITVEVTVSRADR